MKFASEVTRSGNCSRLTVGVFKVDSEILILNNQVSEEGLGKSKKLLNLKSKVFEPFSGNMSF